MSIPFTVASNSEGKTVTAMLFGFFIFTPKSTSIPSRERFLTLTFSIPPIVTGCRLTQEKKHTDNRQYRTSNKWFFIKKLVTNKLRIINCRITNNICKFNLLFGNSFHS